MGKAYHVKCASCGYREVFALGAGAERKKMVDAAIEALNEGKYGEETQRFVDAHERGTIICERKLYRCRKCGNLEVRTKMRLAAADCPLSYSQEYYCGRCGKMMGQVKQADLRRLNCPACGRPLTLEKVTDWDIAPDAAL
jgi:DNA-directed RNA polymerase subunit RPC12/RpoP